LTGKLIFLYNVEKHIIIVRWNGAVILDTVFSELRRVEAQQQSEMNRDMENFYNLRRIPAIKDKSGFIYESKRVAPRV